MYQIEENESFAMILRKFVKASSIVNARTPFVRKTVLNNPQIKQWNKLPAHKVIELYISDDFMDLDKYRPYGESILKKVALLKAEKLKAEKLKIAQSLPSGLKGSLFYMASQGTFNQAAESTGEINFKQNSPFTLGSAFTFFPKDKLYSVSSSAYLSYLVATNNSLTDEKISIPPEIGANVYGEYRWQKYNVTLYSGPDYESFSVFNLPALQNDGKVYIDGVSVIYLTVGMAKSFPLFNRQFFTKMSLSQSMLSSYKNNAPSSSDSSTSGTSTEKYSGLKLLLYLNTKITDKFYIHSLLKYTKMSGPSDLAILRIGIGVGYVLF